MKSLFDELNSSFWSTYFLFRNHSKRPDITYNCLKKKMTLNSRCRHSLYKRKFGALWDTKIIYDAFYPSAHQFFQLFSWNVQQIPDPQRPPVFRRVSSHFSLILIQYDCLTGAAALLPTNNCILSALYAFIH